MAAVSIPPGGLLGLPLPPDSSASGSVMSMGMAMSMSSASFVNNKVRGREDTTCVREHFDFALSNSLGMINVGDTRAGTRRDGAA